MRNRISQKTGGGREERRMGLKWEGRNVAPKNDHRRCDQNQKTGTKVARGGQKGRVLQGEGEKSPPMGEKKGRSFSLEEGSLIGAGKSGKKRMK